MIKPAKQTMLRTQLKASALALAMATLPLSATAAGLGKLTVLSVLGQPLRAEIDITANRDELGSLKAQIAPYSAFAQAGIEYSAILGNLQVSLEKRSNGQPYLLLKSNLAINEPFLDLLLEMNWAAGRLQREYTFLLDPPEALQKPSSVAPITPATPAQSSAATTTPAAVAATELNPADQATSKANAIASQPVATTAEPSSATRAASQSAPATTDQPQNPPRTQTVKTGDTLSRIALDNLSGEVNLDQMLVALFRANPQAFADKNINRLYSGRILQIPTAAEAAAIDAREAHQQIIAQAADFNAYRRKLAAAAAAAQPESAPQQSAQGKIATQVSAPETSPAAQGDKLEISKSAAAQTTASKAALEEEQIAREKSLTEANSRMAELDKNLADMKKALELKNETLATAEQEASITDQESASSSKPAEPATVATETADAAEATEATLPTEETAAAATESIAAKKPAAAAKKPAPAPTPAAEPATSSFLEENPQLLLGAGGILALLLGYAGFKRWQNRRKDPATTHSTSDNEATDSRGPISQSEPSINSVFGANGGQIVDTGSSAALSSLDTDFSVAGIDGTENNEGVDPIAEADVYMAYGRNAQAEEILLDALKADPSRLAIHLKLLEIYAARKSLKQFEGIAEGLRDQTQGQGEAWQQARELGHTLDPDNPLYDPQAVVTPAAQSEAAYDPTATMVMAPAIDMNAATSADHGLSSIDSTNTDSLDFELDLGGGDDEPAADNMDFDLGAGEPAMTLDADAADAAIAATDPEDPAATDTDHDAALIDTATESSSVMNFELDTPALSTSSAGLDLSADTVKDHDVQISETLELPADELATAASNLRDFVHETASVSQSLPPQITDETADFPLQSPEISHSFNEEHDSLQPTAEEFEAALADSEALDKDETEQRQPAISSSGIDLSAINLELDELPPLAIPDQPSMASPDDFERPAADNTLELPPLSAAAQSLATPLTASQPPASPDNTPGPAEVDTKLELAAAYEEMGDKEGARELLQEVINEGSAAQQAIARTRLSQLD